MGFCSCTGIRACRNGVRVLIHLHAAMSLLSRSPSSAKLLFQKPEVLDFQPPICVRIQAIEELLCLV